MRGAILPFPQYSFMGIAQLKHTFTYTAEYNSTDTVNINDDLEKVRRKQM
jgi:hypothetical protein